MTETEAPPVPPPQAPAEPQAAPTGPRLMHATLPDLLATTVHYAAPATQALEQAFRAHLEAHPGSQAVKDVSHYNAVRDWCEANPDDAARIVLAVVYLANGRYVVQQPPAETVAAEPPPAGEAPADGEPAAATPT